MVDRKEMLAGIERVVVKVGTSSITLEDGSVDREFMDRMAEQVSTLIDGGKQVVIVSSGAIGIGVHSLGLRPKPAEVPIRQAAASVGQGILMQEWRNSFEKVGRRVAQILLTYQFYSDRLTYLNLRNNLSTLMEHGVVPIINENDAVCTAEIEAVFGDNDTLSAMVASKIEADLLIILSDVDGLYDRNPRVHEDAHLIPIVEKIDDVILGYGGNPTSTKGVGGMRTKIEAARICCMAGCHMVIANSAIDNVILRVAEGEEVGTLFVAGRPVAKNRTRWIILASSSGIIDVDRGAMLALQRSNGLLPSGVIGLDGDFSRGDVVELRCEGRVFAKGITDYSSEELARVKGAHSDQIEEILGYRNYVNVIRRENIGFF